MGDPAPPLPILPKGGPAGARVRSLAHSDASLSVEANRSFQFECKETVPVLILTRRRGESIKIGSDVSVTVLDIKGGQIRLGISAPKKIPVRREGIFEQIQEKDRLRDAAVRLR